MKNEYMMKEYMLLREKDMNNIWINEWINNHMNKYSYENDIIDTPIERKGK